jgi:peptide/nickel transport system permease protein
MTVALERPGIPLAPTRPRRAARARIHRSGKAAVVILMVIAGAAVVGPYLWGRDPLAQDTLARLTNRSLAHPLGTDKYGRDIFARLLMGARWSLAGATIVCLGTSAVGFLIGALAAMSGRIVDGVIGRLVESLLAMPGLVMALALTAVLGPSFKDLLFALIVTSWPRYARIYRSLILKEREVGYVESAAALGATKGRLVFRHIVPNVIGPAAVLATSNFGGVILGLASLSFLGLGMQPPTPEWGVMINEARAYFQSYPWQMIAPGLCIALTVLAINLAGDALRDAFDPRATHQAS